ncbi:MAG: CHASE2 domain-containing protein [Cyanomargarita calcarea GSE-NOS-MK-12-04C]|jgi:CHASE2 domain-containing sensor protein|uniref:CHASE2 domain-containing protein n=1 Tax=Cyanomargarita calcarea GSE-NOS-MK-12-04C TaxID=2839659 RepID=A0A951UQT4_9CYAN|nr:CHASE2 domain-containing protein [Cyanomargarita calcarea GSE-NOS-MK-12-04C]
MRKLVVLKLDGDLQQGVQVTLEIGEETERPCIEITGKLPPNQDMAIAIDQWQSSYRSLGQPTRIKAKKIIYDGSISQWRNNCHNKASELRSHLNKWLQSESFRPIREKWLKHLTPSEEVRVLIRTDSMQLEKLPWHLWDLVDRDYPLAEVALSVPDSERVAAGSQKSAKRNKIRILAILGDSDGIDVKQDRQLLEKLPLADTTFLVQPQRQDINDHLWKQPWNILFFAGHSKTNGETGCIYINQTDSLTIADLRYALSNAVTKGLQLAIFNSCDGLGLARELQDLQIPQIIVMREPVPDLVAQTFLRHFLLAFSSGQSLYTAVRTAREKLHGLEGEYPGASWLPVICENPGVVPITWSKPQIEPNHRFRYVLLFSVLITAFLLGIRQLGGLQTWELQAFDLLMRSRPQEQQDSRLLIVTITEDDLQLKEQQHKTGSLSNFTLALLLEKLAPLKPRAIGLDIYRDEPVQPNQTLTTHWNDDNFFAICKVSDRQNNHPGISPPLEVPQSRLGFSDVVQDADGVLRRHLLAMNPAPASPCTTPYALSAQLAFHYLEKDGISAKYNPNGELQLGNVVLKRLQSPISGYQKADTEGYQMLLNYRSYRHSPLEIAPTVTLSQVLKGAVTSEQVKDRIVLIGTTAQSVNDYLPTPYSTQQRFYQQIPGVILQAQMVSQIVSAVKDGRPLLSVWSFWGELLWLWGWSVVGIGIAWRCRSRIYLILVGVGTLSILYTSCLVLLCQGYWVPLVPSALVLIVTIGTVVVIYTNYEVQMK